jgi:hypothetical protein
VHLKRPRKAERPREVGRFGRRKVLPVLIGIVVVSVLVSAAYGLSYFESKDALSQLSTFCASYSTVFHPPFSGHPISHYTVMFGVKNPSPIDAEASWAVRASNQTQGYEVEDYKSFVIPHRDSAYASFSLYVEQANVTLHNSDMTITQSYKISLFTFSQQSGVSRTLPKCP